MNNPPAWAGFFDPPRWNRFLAAVAADFQRRGVAHQIDANGGCVRLADGRVFGLTNIAQMCCQSPEERWAYLLDHHFGIAFAPPQDETEGIAKDFGRARSLIKIRLWERSALPSAPMVAWDVADDLVAVLTYDLPNMLATVGRSDAEKWPASKADLWHIGLANVRSEGKLEAPAVNVGDGAQVHVLEGNATYFAASHLLFLEAYAGAAPNGAIVAVPRRHTVVFHTIQDLKVVNAINSMLSVVPRMYLEGPGSIAASLYWWRPNQALMLLPVKFTEDAAEFHPPPAFVELLNRLR